MDYRIKNKISAFVSSFSNTGWSSMMTVPESGFRIPLNIFKKVLLPAPICPKQTENVFIVNGSGYMIKCHFFTIMTYLDCQPESL